MIHATFITLFCFYFSTAAKWTDTHRMFLQDLLYVHFFLLLFIYDVCLELYHKSILVVDSANLSIRFSIFFDIQTLLSRLPHHALPNFLLHVLLDSFFCFVVHLFFQLNNSTYIVILVYVWLSTHLFSL